MPGSMTWGYVLYYLKDGEPNFMGLYQTNEAAEADRVIVSKNQPYDWRVAPIPFLGWGYVAPGVFSQNGPPPLKVVE
jgi:hypothetical protein